MAQRPSAERTRSRGTLRCPWSSEMRAPERTSHARIMPSVHAVNMQGRPGSHLTRMTASGCLISRRSLRVLESQMRTVPFMSAVAHHGLSPGYQLSPSTTCSCASSPRTLPETSEESRTEASRAAVKTTFPSGEMAMACTAVSWNG
eukprot:Amastigsp_a676659_138.p2 type:complete len:146 gc:universal Amastigsp_a676659_138:1301-864(-)